MPGRHRRGHRRQQPLARESHQPAVGVRVERRGVGQVIAVIRAVGGVQVDDDSRVPAREERGQGAAFNAFQFHEVAVQVEAAPILARADATDRAVLLRTVVEADFLVAIRVVVRREQPDGLWQQFLQVADREPSREVEDRLLAFDLAGMDVRHDEHHRPAAGPCRLGRCRRRIADDGQHQVASFLGAAERLEPQPGHPVGERGQKATDVRLATGLFEARLLGAAERYGSLC